MVGLGCKITLINVSVLEISRRRRGEYINVSFLSEGCRSDRH
jgi:hypothetical protein